MFIRRLILALGVLSVGSFGAIAADLPVKAPYIVAPPPFSWTGFYVGGNVGYSWGRAKDDFNSFAANGGGSTVCLPTGGAICVVANNSTSMNGAIGGLQAGYNWQTGNIIVGIKSDFQISGQKGDYAFTTTFPFPVPPGVISVANSEKLEWLGTLRGRLGFAADRWFLYGTGGLAYGLVKVEGSAAATGFPAGVGLACIPNGCPFLPFGSWSNSKTKVGWTAGFGIERVIGNDHWTVKFEYLYVDLGTVGTTFATPAGCYGNGTVGFAGCVNTAAGSGTISTRVTDNIVRLGVNYRF